MISKLIIIDYLRIGTIYAATATCYVVGLYTLTYVGAHLINWVMKMVPERPKFGDPNFAARNNAGWARLNEQSISNNLL